jgi:hypothetical protein
LERDQGERDYGIDLTVECFDDGEPSGAALLFQLKGTADAPPTEEARTIPLDFKVDHLTRVERFATPVLLVWCPVGAAESCCWFLWLQSYVAVVLDQENPTWRTQKYVRLQIPTDNRLPEPANYDRLRHIAGHPARAAAMGQLARIAHEAALVLEDPPALRERFAEALELDEIYADHRWRWAQDQRLIMECGMRACDLTLRGSDPSDEELRELGWETKADANLTGEERFTRLGYTAHRCARWMSNTIALYFDDRLRHTVWDTVGDHDF